MPKGFHNGFHNQNHDKNSFSIAEQQFKDYCFKHGIDIKDLLHEHKVKFKWVKGSTTKSSIVHPDFLHITTRIIIEINPMFHYTYKPVVVRDARKIKQLRKHGYKVFRIKVFIGTVKGKYTTKLNLKYANKVVNIMKRAKQSREQLGYYCR